MAAQRAKAATEKKGTTVAVGVGGDDDVADVAGTAATAVRTLGLRGRCSRRPKFQQQRPFKR